MLVNIYQAKAQLSALLERALAGEDVIIARAGKPIARITPIALPSTSRSGVRFGGLKPAKLKLAADFHALSTDDDLLGA
ncbi:MAG: type II toxin-antitoxin system Phd/YefM family antitoxin [Gammaproteobacteria bacterium]